MIFCNLDELQQKRTSTGTCGSKISTQIFEVEFFLENNCRKLKIVFEWRLLDRFLEFLNIEMRIFKGTKMNIMKLLGH